jgi:peroxiredoxin
LPFVVSLCQLLLAVVFAVAGVAKLVDRTGTRRAVEAFGVPARLASAGATLLPLVELAIAAALIPASTAGSGALAAVALLAIFSVAIARTLRTGSAPDCNCFGGLTQTEIGRGTLVRNLVLAALAAFVLFSGVTVSAFRWVIVPAARDRPGIAILVVGLAGLSWFCWQLLRQNGRLLLRLEEGEGAAAGSKTLTPLEPGTAAPVFAGRDLQGEAISLESLLDPGLPVALVFTDPGCGACSTALEAVAHAQHERPGEMTVAVISTGSIDRIEEKANQYGLHRVVPQDDESLFDSYRVNGVPGVVQIDSRGLLTGHPVLGADEVRAAVLGTALAAPVGPAGADAR